MKTLELVSPVPEEPGSPSKIPHLYTAMDVSDLQHGIFMNLRRLRLFLSNFVGPVRRYYEEQNELIGLMENVYADDDENGSEDSKDHPELYLTNVAITLSYASNILLLALKLWALVVSGSLAMLASVLDSCLGKTLILKMVLGEIVCGVDILSGSILYCAQHLVERRDKYKYPVGKQRIQPISTIVFACLMAMSALQVICYNL